MKVSSPKKLEFELEDDSEDENDGDDVSWERFLKVKSSREKVEILKRKLLAKLGETLLLKKVSFATFIIGICCVCFQQCYMQVHEYFKYGVRSQVSHHFPNSTLLLIPGVTVCNNNRMKMNKLILESPSLREKIEKYSSTQKFDDKTKYLDRSTQLKQMRAIREIVENTVNISTLINTLPIGKFFELSRGSMITDINCNGLWGKKYNCENFRIIESYQGVGCYTLFYLGSILESISSGIAFQFNTSLLGGKKKINPFEEHEIAEILVDFEPYEHADFQRDIGGKVVIHSTGHVGSVRDMAQSIEPGKRYEMLLTRRMTGRLPPPYKSMCLDYKSQNSYQFTERVGSPPSIVLDTTTCSRNCILRLTTKRCNCWPPEVPYFPNDSTIIENGQDYKICAYVDDIHRNNSDELYVQCYKKSYTDCRNECRRGCWTEDYKMQVMSTSWPGLATMRRANYELERKELRRLRNCCAVISLKYLEYTETKQMMYPRLTLAQLASNVGGIVSGLIGVSAVTLYRYVTRSLFPAGSWRKRAVAPGSGAGGGQIERRRRRRRRLQRLVGSARGNDRGGNSDNRGQNSRAAG